MAVSQYFNEFIIFSFIGWIYECTYCTVKEKSWQNRGFFFGPICPIYGVGATSCVIVFGRLIPYLRGAAAHTQNTPLWEIFLICMLGSAVMEYSTSFVLEKLFHARWWDYSEVPLNLNGRICLPASLGFGVAGIVIVTYIFPIVYKAETLITLPWLNEVLSLVFMFVFGVDAALTVSSLKGLLEKVESAEEEFNLRMESAVETIGDRAGQMKEGVLSARERLQLRNMRKIRFRLPTVDAIRKDGKEEGEETQDEA